MLWLLLDVLAWITLIPLAICAASLLMLECACYIDDQTEKRFLRQKLEAGRFSQAPLALMRERMNKARAKKNAK